jgi:flagellar basal-body rod protein FlgC
MNDFLSLDMSGAGMRAQRIRMRVISENLANSETVGPNGPYQRKDVVFKAHPITDFDSTLAESLGGAADKAPLSMVGVSEEQTDPTPPLEVYEPWNPQADARGMVKKPNINVIREMSDMMESSRSYEANLSVAKATQDMLLAASELVKR